MEDEPSFSLEDWKERYMAFNNNKRSKVVEFFRQNDKDGDRRLTRKVNVVELRAMEGIYFVIYAKEAKSCMVDEFIFVIFSLSTSFLIQAATRQEVTRLR